MISFKEKSRLRAFRHIRYYINKGFEVSAVLINNIYNVTISEYKIPKNKKGEEI